MRFVTKQYEFRKIRDNSNIKIFFDLQILFKFAMYVF